MTKVFALVAAVMLIVAPLGAHWLELNVAAVAFAVLGVAAALDDRQRIDAVKP